jgi:hypothetical protein
MSTVGLILVIALPVLACAAVIVAELGGHLVRTLPVPPQIDAYDVDHDYRAALMARYPNVPPSQGAQS